MGAGLLDESGSVRISPQQRTVTGAAMTLIAVREGQEVARIHGPNRSGYVLEYRNPETGIDTRLTRTNLHVLRGIAERFYPGLDWSQSQGTLVSSGRAVG
jgi:hypothetical protein